MESLGTGARGSYACCWLLAWGYAWLDAWLGGLALGAWLWGLGFGGLALSLQHQLLLKLLF